MSGSNPVSVNEIATEEQERGEVLPTPAGSSLTPRDVWYAVSAVRLARTAQLVRSSAIGEVMKALVVSRGLPRCTNPAAAVRAAARGGLRFARWFGGLDTCLTRSLVAGAMLCRDQDVELHLGCRVSEGRAPIDGHAWLVVDGHRFETTGAQTGEKPYTTMVQLPYRPNPGEDEGDASNRAS